MFIFLGVSSVVFATSTVVLAVLYLQARGELVEFKDIRDLREQKEKLARELKK